MRQPIDCLLPLVDHTHIRHEHEGGILNRGIRHVCSSQGPVLNRGKRSGFSRHRHFQNTTLTRNPEEMTVVIERTGEAEMDDMWSFVAKKGHQRWLWYAINHHTGTVL